MDKSQLTVLAQDALALATKHYGVKLLKKASPYLVTGVLLLSWSGLLPRERIETKESLKCSVCRRKKKGNLLIIHNPMGGKLTICESCEKKEYKKMWQLIKGGKE